MQDYKGYVFQQLVFPTYVPTAWVDSLTLF